MVIQRIQTLWLLVSVILMVVIGIIPFGSAGDGVPVYLNDCTTLAILDWLSIVLLILAIFSFKNLKLQKKITILSFLMMIGLGVITTLYVIWNLNLSEISFLSCIFLLLAMIFSLLGYRGMSRDQKKLRDSDRLWS